MSVGIGWPGNNHISIRAEDARSYQFGPEGFSERWEQNLGTWEYNKGTRADFICD